MNQHRVVTRYEKNTQHPGGRHVMQFRSRRRDGRSIAGLAATIASSGCALLACAGGAERAPAGPPNVPRPAAIAAAAAEAPAPLATVPPAPEPAPAAKPALPLEPVVTLSAGLAHTCALHRDGRVSCWGDNGVGQAGGAPTKDSGSEPHWVPLPEPAVQIAAGYYHTCALVRRGTVWCFGSFLAGTQASAGGIAGTTALGGERADLGVPVEVPAASGGEPVRRIAVSQNTPRACAVRGREVVCWNTSGSSQPMAPAERIEIPDVEELAVGAARACVIVRRAGKRRIECWEQGDKRPSATGWSGASPVDLSMGSLHACARDERGGAFCWRVGVTGTRWWKKLPKRVTGLGKGGARSLVAGGDFACAASQDGRAHCFLAEREGLPTEVASSAWAAPREDALHIDGVYGAVLVTAGSARNVFGHGHACALTRSGDVTCWGDNDSGQLGDGNRIASSPAVTVLAPR